MGGLCEQTQGIDGQVPEELITETPANIEVTHKHVDVATANEIIAEPVEKVKETKEEEEPLVDLSEPKAEKTSAIEVIDGKVNAIEITRTTTATAAATTTTGEDESSTKVDTNEIKQKVVEEEKINETATSS